MSRSGPPDSAATGRGRRWLAHASILPGLAVLAGLLLYSADDALDRSGPEPAAVVATQPPAQRPYLARGDSIAFSREFYIFMVCDGETAEAVYSGHISQLYATLRPSRDRETMIDLLEGRPTPLPDYARTFYSPCFQTAVENGAFP